MAKGKKFVIGVDGGGTKTMVVLADEKGKIIAQAVSGASSPRNAGIKLAAKNAAQGIYDAIKSKSDLGVASTFIGLPAVEEEYKDKKTEIIEELRKYKKIAKIFRGKVMVGSDQLVAFRSGTDAKNGIVAICGTGSAIHGWKGKKEALVNDFGWTDKGSAGWIGYRVMEEIAEAFDGRRQKTSLAALVFKKYKYSNISKLLRFLYEDSMSDLPKLAVLCDLAANRGDKAAKEILAVAGKEIARSVITAKRRLGFPAKEKIPLVLVGSVFNSERFYRAFIYNLGQRHNFNILRSRKPVAGAVKLAIENI